MNNFFETAGEATVLMVLLSVFYFLLEKIGFPVMWFRSERLLETKQVEYSLGNERVIEKVEMYGYDIHLIFLFIFGIWLAIFLALLIIKKKIKK